MCTNGRTDTNHEPKTGFKEICVVPDIVHSEIYCMEQSPSRKSNEFSVCQDIPRNIWNPKVHYSSHNCPPPVPILRNIDPVNNPASHLINIYLNNEPALHKLLTFHFTKLLVPFSLHQSINPSLKLTDSFVTQFHF